MGCSRGWQGWVDRAGSQSHAYSLTVHRAGRVSPTPTVSLPTGRADSVPHLQSHCTQGGQSQSHAYSLTAHRAGRVSLTPNVLLSRCSPCSPGPSPARPCLCAKFRLRCPVMYSCYSPMCFPDERTLTSPCRSPPSPLSGYLPQDITPGLPSWR